MQNIQEQVGRSCSLGTCVTAYNLQQHRLDSGHDEDNQSGNTGAVSMKARLARSGHCAQVLGQLLLISGGILRDGGANVDIIVIDLNTMDYIQ